MWHFDMFGTLKVFKLIGPSNDGWRHGRGTYLFCMENRISGHLSPGQLYFWANVFLIKSYLGNCLSRRMSLWANVFLCNRLSGQMSFWANIFWANVRLGKCLSGQMSSGQMSFWQMSFWLNVLLGKCRMGKCHGTKLCQDKVAGYKHICAMYRQWESMF
jgi:hypothetical protein